MQAVINTQGDYSYAYVCLFELCNSLHCTEQTASSKETLNSTLVVSSLRRQFNCNRMGIKHTRTHLKHTIHIDHKT